ncbi:MAG: permease-like cell division protein FtsX, partial [Bacteroidaceae bacterium]|nr:permease-like cell division protein FtsX [Bacteroidaceae bacterium]
MTSCISTTLVLVLLGTIVLFVLTARNLSAYVRENINVSVLISDELTEGEIDSMRLGLLNTEFVKSVEYISKERALEETTTELGTDPADFLGFNPFTASFELKVKADYANTDSLSKIVGRLDADEDVMGVDYDKETMDSVNKNIRKISVI